MNLTLRTKFKDVTLRTLEKLSPRNKIEKLNSLALNNTSLVDQIIKFNSENRIGLYRIPTNLLPFPTHPIANDWNWREILLPCFEYTGNLAKELGIGISFHADEYTIINTPAEQVFNNSFNSLLYLSDVLDMMDVNGKIVVHVGGIYHNKEESLDRFAANFYKLPEHVRVKLIIENDDKQYGWKDVYKLCEKLKLHQVLDIHHYQVFNPHEPLTKGIIREIFSTWEEGVPKIHLSSPRSSTEQRAHADYINVEDFLWFYEMSKDFKYDIMLEAKAKEQAVFKFRDDLKNYGIDLEKLDC